ncbi:MAG: hypothetical protein U0R17_03535 [Acidimicrobiia bacterium]
MTTFKDLDSQENVSVPVDLEQKAISRTTSRVRKQRMIASAFASVLLIAVLGVAFAANTSNGSNVTPANKNRLEKIKGDDKTTNTVVGQEDQGDNSESEVSTTNGTRVDDSETRNSGVTTTTHDDNEAEQEDDHNSTSTTEIKDHSGSNSGSGSSD